MLASGCRYWVRPSPSIPHATDHHSSPLLGGTFSNPAEKYPSLFDYPIFRTYPYLLPSLIAALVALIGAVFGFFCLEEVRVPA